jgi:flagellar FliJ protein
MAPFRFRLERVLQFRRESQRQVQTALAACQRIRDQAQASLAAAEAGVAECHMRLQESIPGPMAGSVAVPLALLRQHGLAMRACAARAHAAEQEVRRRREQLVNARVRTRTLEMLRAQRRQQHQQAEALQERRAEDDVVHTAVARRSQQARGRGRPACRRGLQ